MASPHIATRAALPWLVVLCVTALCACGGDRALSIGAKINSENMILAEMMAQVARDEGIAVRKRIPYGNTFDCQEGIKAATIDLYPEYTGTGLSMMGVPPVAEADEALERVGELFRPFGLRWLSRFGVDNSYVLVVREDYAARHNIERISQLADIEGGIRLATGKEFVNRVVDGLPALVRRYGFGDARTVLETDDKQELYDALLRDHVDVAVGYATDGHIEEFRLVMLEDDARLFSHYEAAPLVREDALKRFPRLERVHDRLAQVLDNANARTLNKRVELNGADPQVVAREFLIDAGILEQGEQAKTLKKLIVAIPQSTPEEKFSRLNGKALAALRRTNAGRRLELKPFADPVAAVAAGDAYVAVLGAEFFFELRSDTRLPVLVGQVEAVCPVGFRMLHVLAKQGRIDPNGKLWSQVKRVGVGLQGGATHRLSDVLMEAYEVGGDIELAYGGTEEQLAELRNGKLDAVLKLIKPGAPQLTVALRDAELALLPLTDWDEAEREFRYPFVRTSRIPAKTYPGVDHAVDTVSTQVVIAGPAQLDRHIGSHGPADALDTARKPLPLAVKKGLNDALSGPRMIDPTLPGESIGVGRKHAELTPLNPAPEISLLTAVVLLLLIYVLVEVFRRKPTANDSGDEPPPPTSDEPETASEA